MLIDSHAHLDSPRYDDDREAMLRRAAEAGVGAVLAIGIGEGPAEMHQALEICREFNGKPGMPRLYASAGIYPHNAPEADEAALPSSTISGPAGGDRLRRDRARLLPRGRRPSRSAAQGLSASSRSPRRARRPILIHCRPKDGTRTRGTICLRSSKNIGVTPALAA